MFLSLFLLACTPASIDLGEKGSGGGDSGTSLDSTTTDDSSGHTTTDDSSGTTLPSTPLSCKDILEQNPRSQTGIYEIDPDGTQANPAFSVWCDMDTDGGGWTRWWWFHADRNVDWRRVTDMLGAELGDCDPNADSCFARIPDANASELRASDGTDWASWEFQRNNSTSSRAYDAFVNRTPSDFVLDSYTDAWNPTRQSSNSNTLTDPYECDADRDIPSDGRCRNFWYADMRGPEGTLRSFNLDDDGGYGQTAFGAGADNSGQGQGCDFLEQRLASTNESCEGELYYR